jgi:hypothetical protein
MNALLDRFRLRREPLAYLAFAVVVVLGGHQVLFEGKSVVEVLGDNYIEGLILGLATLLGRASVYSPATVDRANNHIVEE